MPKAETMKNETLKTNELRHGNLFETTRNTSKKGWYVDRLDVATEFNLIEEFSESYRPLAITHVNLMKVGAKNMTGGACISIPNISCELHFEIYPDEVVCILKGNFTELILDPLKHIHTVQNLYFILSNGQELTIKSDG